MTPPKKSTADKISFEKYVQNAVKRLGSKKDAQYFTELLTDLVKNNTIPVELLDNIPQNSGHIGKTRFDQIFDAAMFLAFPDYQQATLERFIGESTQDDIKLWRVVLPEKYKIAHVFIRARTYQDAFALACDYACRAHLRLYRTIPVDISIRVMFVTEKALRRHLNVRWANRVKKRHTLQIRAREFTTKQVNGARIVALGHTSNDPRRSIAKYAEVRDLVRARLKAGLVKISSVELETLKDDT